MMGEGKPQLLSWEIKKPPHAGYGVLKFSGGNVPGKNGPEPTELAAVIDVENSKVIAIQPHRQGVRVAGWTWEENRLQVASIDGVTDEFTLRATKPQAAPVTGYSERKTYRDTASGSTWAPWDQPFGMPTNSGDRRPQRKASKHKPKTLFQLLFN